MKQAKTAKPIYTPPQAQAIELLRQDILANSPEDIGEDLDWNS